MARNYNHREIERKWQAEWEKQKLYETPDSVPGKENYYALVEFPYTSGDLHVGHWYAYTVPDMFARMKRMQGKNVMFPIGFDTFGLPAENAALKQNAGPAEWTDENVAKMRTQLKTLGCAFDWSRELATCDPGYMKWSQWLFLQFYKNGLAYRGKAKVNWCPNDQTTLANEQVIDGKCERCDAEVVQKDLEQWFMKITDYADRLLEDLEPLNWPNAIKESQRNWIGRSDGAELEFGIKNSELKIKVFTTRPDTLFGATYMVLAPEHPLIQELSSTTVNWSSVKKYVEDAKKKTELTRMADKEKTGVRLDGITAINPASKEEIPVYVADYVLGGYGTGAIMAVPAHDERDFEFAKKFNLRIKPVVRSGGSVQPGWTIENYADEWNDHYSNPGKLYDSGQLTGQDSEETKRKITEFVGGKLTKTYKFRDWIVSRQRYWGAPIPIVYDPEGKAHPIPEEHLPWLLPTDADIKPKGTSPLGSSKELVERTENIFGKGWRPETDTMDGFVDNSWYFLRYLDPKNDKEFSSLEKQKVWMPIARYSGGAEHTTVHVLYSRFFVKALYDMGLATVSEPYTERINRGLVLAEDGRKMSKRWGNVIAPDEQVANVGADAVRMYLAFIGPYNEVGSFPWNTNSLIGVRRFLERVAGLSEIVKEGVSVTDEILLNQSIKKVGEDIESMKFNTSVSQLMILSNHFIKTGSISRGEYEIFLKLLAPFAPHLTEELWHELGHNTSIHLETWPSFDTSKLETDTAILAVQINGKTRGTIVVSRASTEDDATIAARNDTKLARLIPTDLKRVVYVPGKILNFIA